MQKLIGYTVLCIAFGMLLMIIIQSTWIGLILIAIFVIVGYNLFSCD